MENNAYSTVIDEVKKDYNEKLAEANERAKKAEKAFIDLTRHRSTHSAMGSTTSINKAPDAALQKRTSETMISAMSPYPFNSSLEKVQVCLFFLFKQVSVFQLEFMIKWLYWKSISSQR